MAKYSIGVDLGGTKIIAGVINTETGEVIAHAKKKTKKEKGSDLIIQKIIESIEKALCLSQIPIEQIDSIGLGLAGQVDRKNGILIAAPNLDCFNINFKEILENHFKKPVFTGNDVEVATIGEMNFGSGMGYDNFVCIFVGTGVGSGIVQNGKITQGASGTAGEIGHIIVDSGGRFCPCGGNGCLEAYASRTAVEKKIRAALKNGHKSIIVDLIKDDGIIRSKYLQQAVEENDEVVLNSITEAAEYLSSGLATVINFLNPKLIILGGGLIEAVDLFYELSIKKAIAKALPIPGGQIKITKTKLADFSGIVGASLLQNYR
ncbi:MAG: ROK family protein [Candidatus Gastranaerophilaceae bacterium]|jgi:glucokinase